MCEESTKSMYSKHKDKMEAKEGAIPDKPVINETHILLFYKYIKLDKEIVDELYKQQLSIGKKLDITGRIHVGPEGKLYIYKINYILSF